MITPVRILGPIIDNIEWELPDKWPASKSYTPRRVSASGVSRCSRQWYYTLTGEAKVENRKPQWDLAAAQGTWIHERIQEELLGYDLVGETEMYLQSDHFLSGRIDGILSDRPTLLEIKTMGSAYWRGVPDNDKFRSYSDQVQVYLELLNLPEALVVCVRREPIVEGTKTRKTLVKEFLVSRNREHGQQLIDKSERIREATEKLIVPEAEPGSDCFFCPFVRQCLTQDIKDSINYSVKPIVP